MKTCTFTMLAVFLTRTIGVLLSPISNSRRAIISVLTRRAASLSTSFLGFAPSGLFEHLSIQLEPLAEKRHSPRGRNELHTIFASALRRLLRAICWEVLAQNCQQRFQSSAFRGAEFQSRRWNRLRQLRQTLPKNVLFVIRGLENELKG